MSNDNIKIYALTDEGGSIRYIGQSIDPDSRYQQHLVDRAGTSKAEWVQSMISEGLTPGLVILAEVAEDENAFHVENRWIYFGRMNGWELTNTASMKTEEYYSLNGYFERVIVEMGEPEIVEVERVVEVKVEKQAVIPTMQDVKQAIIGLTAKLIVKLPSIAKRLFSTLTMISLVSAFIFSVYAVYLNLKSVEAESEIVTEGILASSFFYVLGGLFFSIVSIGSGNVARIVITVIHLTIFYIVRYGMPF